MYKTVFLFTLLLTYSFNGFSQTVEQLTRQNLNYFEQNDLRKFEETYPLIYFAYLKENLPEYQEAIHTVKEGNTGSTIEKLNELIEEDLFLDEIINDIHFLLLHGTVEWETLLQTISNRKKSYNNALRLQLKEIQNRDQGIRILYLQIKCDSLKNSIHEYMKTVVDKECATQIAALLDTTGWLDPEEIGNEANETLFLGIQHIDDLSIQQKYLPMLQQAVQTGKANGWHLAFLTDRILMNQGKKQIYGTQKIISDNPAKSYIVPLEYPEKVDQLRKESGLPPLAEELEEEGMQWNLQEYLKNLPTIEKMYREHNSQK